MAEISAAPEREETRRRAVLLSSTLYAEHSCTQLYTAGKILERIFHNNRIEAAIGDSLEDNQYGFRKARSTLDEVSVVVNTVRLTISGKRWKEGTKQYCPVATLDIKKCL